MTKYSKKLEVDAVRYTGDNADEIADFLNMAPDSLALSLDVLRGAPFCPGQWLVRDQKGLFDSWTDEDFNAWHSAVDDV